MATTRIISAEAQTPEEERANWSLRPARLSEYIGQRDLIERIRIAIEAARSRGEAMEHVLLHGPPGLGKTTLAHVIAAEMGARIYVMSGAAMTRASDLVGALTRLERGDVLFIDEIHRLPPAVEEFIYPAMEDFRIDVTVEGGMNARAVSLNLKPFTMIGATTRAGLLSSPLRSRFGIGHHLKHYTDEELLAILERSAALLGVGAIERGSLEMIAGRSRGAPRVANRLLRRVRDYAQVRAGGRVARGVIDEALALEGVDVLGLDDLDRAYLRTLSTTFAGGPAGLEAIAATMNDDAGTLEDVVEPFLLQMGFIARTRQGRRVTPQAVEKLGLKCGGSAAPEGLNGAALFGGA